ncbi:MAG: hypothetical protein QOF89_5952 [Acidobacteriota bacterium]|jgi:hypothetical protein|nr:hypothetical protein [Acidobacteriota bacterium]
MLNARFLEAVEPLRGIVKLNYGKIKLHPPDRHQLRTAMALVILW